MTLNKITAGFSFSLLLLAGAATATQKQPRRMPNLMTRYSRPSYKETVSNICIHADELRDMIALKLDYTEAHVMLAELEARTN